VYDDGKMLPPPSESFLCTEELTCGRGARVRVRARAFSGIRAPARLASTAHIELRFSELER
jgi:hypothetical protein